MQSTRKITKAMEMVSASKMKKAQDRMRASRPYVMHTLQIAMHVAKANTEYKHPFLAKRETVRRVGAIVVTTDKGLCGGLNTNVLRLVLNRTRNGGARGSTSTTARSGTRVSAFSAASARTWSRRSCSSAIARVSTSCVGPVKVLLDKYMDGTIDEVHIFFTTFVNTMKQEARHGHMLPIPEEFRTPTGEVRTSDVAAGSWDYIYEPDAKTLLDGVMRRFAEALLFQMVNENMASEQSARMVAMRAASDNAATIIDELQLIYNKTRQAAITKELAEIVGGAAAV